MQIQMSAPSFSVAQVQRVTRFAGNEKVDWKQKLDARLANLVADFHDGTPDQVVGIYVIPKDGYKDVPAEMKTRFNLKPIAKGWTIYRGGVTVSDLAVIAQDEAIRELQYLGAASGKKSLVQTLLEFFRKKF